MMGSVCPGNRAGRVSRYRAISPGIVTHELLSCRHTRPRRALLRAGAASWLGLSLEDFLLRRAVAATGTGPEHAGRRPLRGVILAFCTGGISQLDTFDPKPDAPSEIRGSFASIASALAGVRVCEHLPA